MRLWHLTIPIECLWVHLCPPTTAAQTNLLRAEAGLLTDCAFTSTGSKFRNGATDAMDEHLYPNDGEYETHESCDDFHAVVSNILY